MRYALCIGAGLCQCCITDGCVADVMYVKRRVAEMYVHDVVDARWEVLGASKE